MPKDSLHPDAKVTHQVLVERWLTEEEYDQLALQRKLGWQVSFEQEAAANAQREREEKMDVEQVEVISLTLLPSAE